MVTTPTRTTEIETTTVAAPQVIIIIMTIPFNNSFSKCYTFHIILLTRYIIINKYSTSTRYVDIYAGSLIIIILQLKRDYRNNILLLNKNRVHIFKTTTTTTRKKKSICKKSYFVTFYNYY